MAGRSTARLTGVVFPRGVGTGGFHRPLGEYTDLAWLGAQYAKRSCGQAVQIDQSA